MAKTFTNYPKAAVENAKRALKFREETDNKNSCGTPVGWARANQLANREPISLDTVKRMAQFNRHRQNKDVPYEEGCGGIMWDAWGGTEGVDWAIRTVQQEEKQNMINYDILNDVMDMGYEVERLNSVLQSANGDKVVINIASDGGEVFTGLKIAGLIGSYEGETQANIYGLAASIATVIALAADEVKINRFAFFMIHNAWGFFQGNKEEVTKQKKVLKQIDNLLADLYTTKIIRSGKAKGDREEVLSKIKNMMANETFLTASEAIDMGLVDGYIQEEENELQQQAISNVRKKAQFYNKLPKELLNEMDDKKTLFARILQVFGLSKSDASEALNALPEGEKLEEEPQAKAMEHSEDKEDDKKKEDDKMKAMEEEIKSLKEALKAMEEEKKAMEEDYKAMEEEKKEIKEAKNELEESISNSAPYAKGQEKTVKKSESIFSPEVEESLNKWLNQAIGK